MTSTTAQQARDAQRGSFGDDVPQEVVDSTLAVYDMIDTLSEPQKRLLISRALTAAHKAIADTATAESNGQRIAMVTLSNGFVAIAGYTNEVMREANNETVTGDSAVDAILEHFINTVRESVESTMDPKAREDAQEVVRLVVERCERTGESTNEALAAIMAERAKDNPHLAAAQAASKTTEDTRYGMYL